MWLLILLLLTGTVQAQVTKIDDDTFSEIHQVSVSDLQTKIYSINKEESEWNKGIVELQGKIDNDELRRKTIQTKLDSAADAGVGNAIPLATADKADDLPAPAQVEP